MREATEALAEVVAVSQACAALDFPRSSLYRLRRPATDKEHSPRRRSPRALSTVEQTFVRNVLNSERFCDSAPRQVYATLLDEGVYYCSWRTMYRILREHDEVRERRQQLQRDAVPPAHP